MMSKEKDNKKTYSFRKRLFRFFYMLVGVTIIAMAVYAGFFSYSLQKRTYRDIRQFLSLYNDQTSSNLKSVDYYLMELSNYSTDVSTISMLYDISENYGNVIKISQMFEFNLRSFPVVQGMYAYFPRNTTWVGYSGSSQSQNTFQPFLKKQFQNDETIGNIKNANGLKWIPYVYENKTYLVKTFYYDNSMVGAWTDLTTLSSSLRNLSDMDALILFTDKEGNIISVESPNSENKDLLQSISSIKNDIKLPVDKSMNASEIITVNGDRYMITTVELSYCDYNITAMIPMKKIGETVGIFWRYAVLFLLIVLTAFAIVVFFLNRFIGNTMNMLTSVNKAIVAGDSEQRIDISNENCSEVLEVATTYNSMVDHIQKLKVDVYEERIQKKNFQLFFLRSQVAPHFLINCLNMISYLADGTKENTAILRKMIETLSKHLRYTLSTDDKVPISREIEYLDNYVELTKLRFPGCITYEKDFDEKSMNAAIFPIMLIMFMENAFKFNLVMGEELIVKVKTELYEKDGEKRLHITHIDSGEGYSEDFLNYFNTGFINDPNDKDGNHIGIRNVIRRLRLYYDETATMKLSNEPGMGARIDVDIPYLEYEAPKTEGQTVKGIFS